MMDSVMGETASSIISTLFLCILLVVGVTIARLRSLFAIVMLTGVYSLVSAAWYILVDAVDVGFTEAAVGAGMSTAVLLGAILLTSRKAKPERRLKRLAPFLVCLTAGALLIYATIDLPASGDANSPANAGVGLTYLQVNWYDTGVPNVVTSVLGSYRGFDTLGEAVVVFVAGLAVMLLLGFGERSLSETLRKVREAAKRPPALQQPGEGS